MTTKMKKVWFVDGEIIEQEIPESDIYKQEPVAWISENAGLYHGKPDESLNPLPLYLAPPPCPMCEALARTVMLDQTSHDTSPPQRKPLTLQPVIKDKHGVLRFKRNKLVDALYEHGVKTGLGLNELHCMEFTDEDRQQFAQLIGYSVDGYCGLSYVTDEAAEQAAHGIKETKE